MKYLVAILVFLATYAGTGWFAYDYGVQQERVAWQGKRLDTITTIIDANNALARQVQALQAAKQEVDDEHSRREAAMRRRHDAAYDKLRVAYETGCPSGVSEAPATVSGNDGTPGGDGLRGRITESLVRRVVIPADEQAERLSWCQSYVRTITKEQR